jgi:chemotaxis signal transduction protein
LKRELSLLTGTDLHLVDTALSSSEVPIPESINRLDRRRGYALLLGRVPLLLPRGIFCEFIASPAITPLPNSPKHFLGLLNLRGNLVPVYDLSSIWLNGDVTFAAANRHIVVLGKGDDAAAILCAAPPKMLDLSFSVAETAVRGVPESLAPFITHMHMLNGEPWFEINFHKTFSWLASAS